MCKMGLMHLASTSERKAGPLAYCRAIVKKQTGIRLYTAALAPKLVKNAPGRGWKEVSVSFLFLLLD